MCSNGKDIWQNALRKKCVFLIFQGVTKWKVLALTMVVYIVADNPHRTIEIHIGNPVTEIKIVNTCEVNIRSVHVIYNIKKICIAYF